MDTQVAVWVAALAGAPGLLALFWAVGLWVKLRRVRAEQRTLLPDGTAVGLVERQASLARSVGQVGEDITRLRGEVDQLRADTERSLRSTLRFQGLIRYDAYGDMGGEQSWSLAILNADRTGTVVTSLHARDHARVYLKAMEAGVPSHQLSPEEELAVAKAMKEPISAGSVA